ncbi:SDR family oxidoreductase, partial [Parvibaculum sp.]|uniref:SDR family oxidoreductase n=1 Tax=Parvibaculum sp. TaxID=2024848 RepID=UPI002B921F13
SNSTIWQGEWAEQRASAYGVSVEALPDFYKSRSLLKQQILPEDVAEAILFFSSDRSAKSTGNILNVDGGSAAAFPR